MIQKLAYGCKTSSRGSTIASTFVFLILRYLRSIEPRGFDAAVGQLLNHFRYKEESIPQGLVDSLLV